MATTDYEAFVINLDDRPDRLAEFRRRTRRFSKPIERFPAITQERAAEEGLALYAAPWLACNASHTALCRLVLERDIEWALILEDDVLPVIGFERRVRWALDTAPPDAWLIQLGHLGVAGSRWKRLLRSLSGHAVRSMNLTRREQYWWGSQAYLISKPYAEFILRQPLPNLGHDQFIRQLSEETDLRHHCFVHHPNLAGQSNSSSDIGPQPGNLPGKRHASREWRRLLL